MSEANSLQVENIAADSRFLPNCGRFHTARRLRAWSSQEAYLLLISVLFLATETNCSCVSAMGMPREVEDK